MSVAQYYASFAHEGRAWLSKSRNQGSRWLILARSINGSVSYWLCYSDDLNIIPVDPERPVHLLGVSNRELRKLAA